MDEASSRGPEVKGEEYLYRAITFPSWWVSQEQRPSSAAFNYPNFSVDIASLTDPNNTLSRFRKGTGLVSFNCGKARALSFDARHEKDENYPHNEAHANVYCDCGSRKRKSCSRQLVTLCEVIEEPNVAVLNEIDPKV